MTAATVPATQNDGKIRGWLQKVDVRQHISSALGGVIETDHFISQMAIAFEKTPQLKSCSPVSKFEAANVCAMLGLLPTHGQVALIPRNNKGIMEVTVMPQWQGYQALMLRHPEVKSVSAKMVHVKDTYHYDADSNQFTHQYDPFQDGRVFEDWKDVRGGYLVVTFKDSRDRVYHFVTKETMQKARRCAQSDNIWKSWFQEQCLKTIYRNAFARRVIPMDHLSQHLQEMNELTDEAEGNDPTRVDVPPPSNMTRIEAAKARVQPKPTQTAPATHQQQQETEPVEYEPEVEPDHEPEASQDQADHEEVTRVCRAVMELLAEKADRVKLYTDFGCDAVNGNWPRDGVEKLWDWVTRRNEDSKM